jgi:hypothetical protein
MTDHIKIFEDIYENNIWGTDESEEYKGTSGGGSDIKNVKDVYIPLVKKIIKENNIKSVSDLGCGSFLAGRLIYDDLEVEYNGYDAYSKIIDKHKRDFETSKYNFYHLDFLNKKEEIKSTDLCILKDVIQHWKLNEIYTFLDYLVESKKFKYVLLCNCCNQPHDNTDIESTGGGMPLSARFLPLRKYNPEILTYFLTKEVSLIRVY